MLKRVNAPFFKNKGEINYTSFTRRKRENQNNAHRIASRPPTYIHTYIHTNCKILLLLLLLLLLLSVYPLGPARARARAAAGPLAHYLPPITFPLYGRS